jgi:hypothetical protein
MADPNDPKIEPVRITAPPRPETKAPDSAAESREPVRINLPARPPARPAPPPGPTVPASPSGLKKETARVGAPIPPENKPEAPVQMKKTQPLVTMPESTAPPSVPLTVTSEPAPVIESVSMPLCWGVLGVSAVILIIQIWNYFS